MHAIVTAGGLTENGWKSIGLKYLFPVQVMGQLLRGKTLSTLRRLNEAGKLPPELGASFDALMLRLKQHNWVVYVKKAFRHAEHVLKYLGRYTHRVALSNSRLVSRVNDEVAFRTKCGKAITLSAVEFPRRFVQPVLPNGLQKIRHYGLYSGAAHASLCCARESLSWAESPEIRINIERLKTWREALVHLTARDPLVCPHCGGQLGPQPLDAEARAPPEEVPRAA